MKKLQKCIQEIERECHDKNVFLKADRTSSKLNFLFHLKSKTNLVTLINCNSHLQYYKIYLNFSIKLQEINLNACEEYKTEYKIIKTYPSNYPVTRKKDGGERPEI